MGISRNFTTYPTNVTSKPLLGGEKRKRKEEERKGGFVFFLFISCIHLFSAEPDRAKLTRDKELACIGEI